MIGLANVTTAFIITLWFTCNVLYAQKQADNWFFGNQAGMTFNSGVAVDLPGGRLVTGEGCSSISDVNGSLLFYATGDTIWNRLHQVMQNGDNLLGQASSTQTSIIIPHPGNDSIYYVFTSDRTTIAYASNVGINYSIVNMNLAGGLGAVETGSKNINILPKACEKLAAVRNASNTGVWVMARGLNTDSFHAWLIDCNGLNTTPVSSKAGVLHFGNTNNGVGQMKFSPDGSKLATVSFRFNQVELFDFDNCSGVLSNALSLEQNDTLNEYGVSFSPDNSKLYISSRNDGISYSALHQYDLQAVIPPRILIAEFAGSWRSLQLAIDGKIYLTKGGPNISTIDNPNGLGAACNFILNGIPLSGATAGGLPGFIESYFDPTPITKALQADFYFSSTCSGDSISFSDSSTVNCLNPSWNWTFGNGNTDSNINPSKQLYDSIGIYNITLILNTQCLSDTIVKQLDNRRDVMVTDSQAICDGQTYFIQGALQSESGFFYDTLTRIKGCDSIIETVLSVVQNSNITTTQTVCIGEAYLAGGALQKSEGVYYDTLVSYNGCDSVLITELTVDNCGLFIPNSFSPNNDGINDTWTVRPLDDLFIQVAVYDRWGDEVYIGNNQSIGWDGTFNDKLVNEGVYVYTVKGSYSDGFSFDLKGNISLIR